VARSRRSLARLRRPIFEMSSNVDATGVDRRASFRDDDFVLYSLSQSLFAQTASLSGNAGATGRIALCGRPRVGGLPAYELEDRSTR